MVSTLRHIVVIFVLAPCSLKVQNFNKEDMWLCLITEEHRVASLLS